MKNAPVLFALASLLASCDRPPSVDALAADPSRLHALRTQRVKPGWGGGQRIHRRRPVATGQQGHESEQDGRVLHGRPRQRL